MRFTFRRLAALTAVATALVPAAAAQARPAGADLQQPAGYTCGKDYSRNSVTGDYCVRTTSPGARFGLASSARSVSADQPTRVVVTKSDGFSWDSAAAGAGVALAATLLTAGGLIATRRRSPAIH